MPDEPVVGGIDFRFRGCVKHGNHVVGAARALQHRQAEARAWRLDAAEKRAEQWLVFAEQDQLVSLGPRLIVPGHGSVSDIAKAQRDTGDYLRWLIASLTPLASELQGVGVAVGKFGDAPQFSRLLKHELLHKANVSRAYLQFERGQ